MLSASKSLLALTVILLIASTHCKVDVFWRNIDTHFRENNPDPELGDILKNAELIDVLPTPESIHFTYVLENNDQALVKFKMTPEGSIAGVSAEIIAAVSD